MLHEGNGQGRKNVRSGAAISKSTSMSGNAGLSGEAEAPEIHRQRSPAPRRKEPAPAKAEPVGLHRGLTIEQGFEAIIASCLCHLQPNLALVVDRRNAEALHQARVAIRRLRSALTMFAPLTAGRQLTPIKNELRWLVSEFGDARDFDVYLERHLLEDQRRFARERREDAYDRAAEAITSLRSRLLFLNLLAWMREGKWRTGSNARKMLDPFIDRRIDRLWEKVSDSGVISRMNDNRRHHLRIRVKKLRYALEFTEGLHCRRRGRKRKFGKALKEAQQSLGALQDIVTAGSMMTLNRCLATKQPSARQQKHLVRDADRALSRLRKAGPYWHKKRRRRA
jgi:CHAD domain-containing protein